MQRKLGIAWKLGQAEQPEQGPGAGRWLEKHWLCSEKLPESGLKLWSSCLECLVTSIALLRSKRSMILLYSGKPMNLQHSGQWMVLIHFGKSMVQLNSGKWRLVLNPGK